MIKYLILPDSAKYSNYTDKEKCLWPDGAVSNFEKKVRLGQYGSPGCSLNKSILERCSIELF